MEVSDVAFAYGSKVVLKSVGFSANPGEFVALLGLNGAGKSTILDIMAGLRTADSGSVQIDGRELKQWQARDRAAGSVICRRHPQRASVHRGADCPDGTVRARRPMV